MAIDERDIRRTTEDVHFQLVGPGRGYAPTCSGPVLYRRIAWAGSGEVIGYLWYSDAENAAGYAARAAAGDDALNAGSYWYGLLTDAQQRGLRPSAAVAELDAQGAGGPAAGWLVPGSEEQATSTQRVKESAGL